MIRKRIRSPVGDVKKIKMKNLNRFIISVNGTFKNNKRILKINNMNEIEFIHGNAEYLIRNYPNANYINGFDDYLYGIIPHSLQPLYIGNGFYDNLEINDDDDGNNMFFEYLENHREDYARNNLLLQSFIGHLWDIRPNRRPIIVNPLRINHSEAGTIDIL